MNAAVVQLTARTLLGQRRTLLVGLLALVPVAMALLFRLAAPEDADPARFTARALLGGIVTTTILPLVSLVLGTAAFGQDFEDGTAVYLLGKPLPRWRIVLSRLVTAWLIAAAVLIPTTAAAGLVARQSADPALVLGFTLAVPVGALLYLALFTWLSVLTSRALVAGLLYVFLWEGVISGIFSGVRFFSIRQYTLGLADAFFDLPAVFDPRLSPLQAALLSAAVLPLFTVLAIRRLERWEIGESA
ncbi:ABC transporter permease [Tepidiforma sp.]|uniref:ABC transporter permease n=1 Tax=Tepidiforma sp. TaxID=2682230 RepID=UPI002ADD6BE6|nr:ABC transporter permease [Tepidiforma sp.]